MAWFGHDRGAAGGYTGSQIYFPARCCNEGSVLSGNTVKQPAYIKVRIRMYCIVLGHWWHVTYSRQCGHQSHLWKSSPEPEDGPEGIPVHSCQQAVQWIIGPLQNIHKGLLLLPLPVQSLANIVLSLLSSSSAASSPVDHVSLSKSASAPPTRCPVLHPEIDQCTDGVTDGYQPYYRPQAKSKLCQ